MDAIEAIEATESPLPPEVNIITLNCWGLKFNISKLRKERLEEIGRQLSQTHPAPHIVCLQEVWSHDDYLAIRRSLLSPLPHGKFYHSGAFGAGLAILSHFPITSTTMTPYALNGRPTAFWRGDWYVGKGIAHAALRIGAAPADILDVFTTHTHAAYSSDAADSYRVHRAAQTWQLSKLLAAAADRGHLVVAAGDFNMLPCGREHRLLAAHAPVRDAWRVLHPRSSVGPHPTATAAHSIAENGATSNSIYNTWRAPSHRGAPVPPPDTPDPRAQRLDYIFTTTAAREIDEDGSVVGGWVVRDARVGMATARHPELGCSLSDHFSVEATLVFHTAAAPAPARGAETPAPSISGGWPLPPGRLSNLSAFRRTTTPAPTITATDDDAAAAAAAASGAFLSLHSPAPSHSDSAPPTASSALRADLDTQLLSDIYGDGPSFAPADYSALLTEIRLYQAREKDQVRLRTAHFCFWVFTLVACCIAVWFIPTHSSRLSSTQNHAVNFVLMLLSSLGLVAGCVDGLMALLFFGGSEKRALREFEWEVRNAKRIAQGENSAPIDEVAYGKLN